MPESFTDTNEPLAYAVERIALQYPGSKAVFIRDRYYTYSEFLEITHSIYLQLTEQPGQTRIAVWSNDDVFTYASMLAVNFYGAAYVPLNKKFPSERNGKILKQSKAGLILSSVEADKHLSGISFLNTSEANTRPSTKKFIAKVSQGISYILFTSGTTGEPKGVPVSRYNVNAFFSYYLKNYDFGKNDRFLQVYELTFDVSVFSFFMPLLTGGCCYVLPDEGVKPVKIIEWLQKYKISVVSMVPGVLRYLEKYLNEIKLPDLRFSFFSGDALYYDLALKWKKCVSNGVIHNFYGPTETTIVCTYYPFDQKNAFLESENGIVPLGKPFENMDFLILDENNELCERGELCLSGPQVISGYLNGENENKFFVHRSKRYYRTGDIASVNSKGNLLFYGRVDHQVKIDGYRVELAEIENALINITKKDVAVVCVNSNGLNKLIAFVRAEQQTTKPITDKLVKILPEYMIPQKYVFLEQFPLNTNGKTDRKALLNSYI